MHYCRDGLKAVLSRHRQRRGKAAMSLTEARQGGELEAEARQTKFEAKGRGKATPENSPSPRCIAVANLVALSLSNCMTEGKWPRGPALLG